MAGIVGYLGNKISTKIDNSKELLDLFDGKIFIKEVEKFFSNMWTGFKFPIFEMHSKINLMLAN